jgi:3-oxoadipate enol-lactonase
MQLLQTKTGVLHIWTSKLVSTRKTLVFINSLGTDYRIWDGVAAALGDRFNIVLHDKAGHGLSSERLRQAKIEDYADDLIAILQHLQLTKVIVCGISVGGLIAQSLYQKQPDMIKALILSNTALKIGTAETWGTRIAAIKTGGIASIADSILERWFAPKFKEHRKDEYSIYHNMLVRTSPQGYLACCEAIRDADFTNAAANISVPVLCIGGELDGSTPSALVEDMASHIPAAKFELIKGAAHLPCIEQPETYAKLITTFVETI